MTGATSAVTTANFVVISGVFSVETTTGNDDDDVIVVDVSSHPSPVPRQYV